MRAIAMSTLDDPSTHDAEPRNYLVAGAISGQPPLHRSAQSAPPPPEGAHYPPPQELAAGVNRVRTDTDAVMNELSLSMERFADMMGTSELSPLLPGGLRGQVGFRRDGEPPAAQPLAHDATRVQEYSGVYEQQQHRSVTPSFGVQQFTAGSGSVGFSVLQQRPVTAPPIGGGAPSFYSPPAAAGGVAVGYEAKPSPDLAAPASSAHEHSLDGGHLRRPAASVMHQHSGLRGSSGGDGGLGGGYLQQQQPMADSPSGPHHSSLPDSTVTLISAGTSPAPSSLASRPMSRDEASALGGVGGSGAHHLGGPAGMVLLAPRTASGGSTASGGPGGGVSYYYSGAPPGGPGTEAYHQPQLYNAYAPPHPGAPPQQQHMWATDEPPPRLQYAAGGPPPQMHYQPQLAPPGHPHYNFQPGFPPQEQQAPPPAGHPHYSFQPGPAGEAAGGPPLPPGPQSWAGPPPGYYAAGGPPPPGFVYAPAPGAPPPYFAPGHPAPGGPVSFAYAPQQPMHQQGPQYYYAPQPIMHQGPPPPQYFHPYAPVPPHGHGQGGPYGAAIVYPTPLPPPGSDARYGGYLQPQQHFGGRGGGHFEQGPPHDHRRGGGGGGGGRTSGGPPPPARSAVLEDFRAGRLMLHDAREVAGHLADFAQDHAGYKFVLARLNSGAPAERDAILRDVLPVASAVMCDAAGHLVAERLLEVCTPEQRAALAGRLRDQVLNMSLHANGCRVVQRALECLPPELKGDLLTELDGHVLKCVQDQHGNHVIQKCIEQVKGAGVDFILSTFHGAVTRLSMHPYGCRIVQRILEHCSAEQVAPVLTEVMRDCEALLQHQYGNYVIQCVLEHGLPEHRSLIIGHLLGAVLVLAQHKFASNVVERCLEFGSAREKSAVVDEVLVPTLAMVALEPGRCLPDERSSRVTPLQTLMADPFGNYVVQKILDVADDRQRAAMVELLRAYAPTLRRYPYGKHILTRVDKMAAKMMMPAQQAPALPPAAGGAVEQQPHGVGGYTAAPAASQLPAADVGPALAAPDASYAAAPSSAPLQQLQHSGLSLSAPSMSQPQAYGFIDVGSAVFEPRSSSSVVGVFSAQQ